MKATVLENSIRNSLPTLSKVAGVAVSVIGGMTLLGWAFGIGVLVRWRPETKAMNPLSAIAFILAGLALWQVGGTEPRARAK
ncbi:MAG TPA: hypothetical protein VNT26_07025, partial [Candidatus Sulfotelmatobacter sp.]|nr:hypothetical protein [Candidatus Sulfotelmatobacter sp.]